jgi:hypothetical protein
MINPQKGIDLMNNTSIIIRILFAVTIFQHSMDPNNYRTIMVGHTFSKLYATVLHLKLSGSLRGGNLELEDRLDFDLSTKPLITSSHSGPSLRRHDIALRKFTVVLWTFRKLLISVPREALFQRLRDIGISETLLSAIMRLYESVLGRLRTTHGISDFIRSTIGVKQGCPLSPTLFGIYIDELESFLHEHIQDGDGCLLHQVLISILLFADDVILLASSPKGCRDNWMPWPSFVTFVS